MTSRDHHEVRDWINVYGIKMNVESKKPEVVGNFNPVTKMLIS